jgi:chromosomal replication initiation ATPase DnaA
MAPVAGSARMSAQMEALRDQLAVCRKIIREFETKTAPFSEPELIFKHPTLLQIVNAVSAHTGVKPQAITGRTQTSRTVDARKRVYYLASEIGQLPIKQVAAKLGRHHSTVLQSLKLIQRSIDKGDKKLIADIAAITAALA